jgi:hypothetical protein
LYKGKSLLDRNLFYTWSLDDGSFNSLFAAWESANYDHKLTPSINRINPNLGYEPENIEWITHSENSKKTTRWNKNGTLPINVLMKL